MADQQRENTPTTSTAAPQVVITDLTYLRDPEAAFVQMRNGVDVIVSPTNGCARMTLSSSLVSDVQLDDD